MVTTIGGSCVAIWKETSVESERLRFIERVTAEEPVTELCRQSGISRKTGYKLTPSL